ncbi:MAG: hypothetical protein OXO50_06960 [Caldilineaceae bacterium]|nr:hypothetical protein [Caldilineaceae bacterium]
MSSLRNIALLLVLALILVACAPAPAAPAADQPADTMAEAPAETTTGDDICPARGGTLTLDFSSRALVVPIWGWGYEQQKLVFGKLVRTGTDNVPHPDLAESWEISDDATEFTFHLHQHPARAHLQPVARARSQGRRQSPLVHHRDPDRYRPLQICGRQER